MEDHPQEPSVPAGDSPADLLDPSRFRRLLAAALALPPTAVALVAVALTVEGLATPIPAAAALACGALLALATRRRLFQLSRAYEQVLSEQRRQAGMVHEREALFSAFMDHHSGVAYMKDAAGRLVYVNAGMERLFRRTRDELLGKRCSDLLPLELADRLHEHDQAVLASGRAGQFLETIPAANGDAHRWLVLKFPFTSAAGQRYLGAVALDMEERERALDEVQRVNAELERRVDERTTELTAANRELEAFGYCVSHDLRAPLRAIDGFARAVLEDRAGTLDAEARDHLERVRAAAARMDQLIAELLRLSRLTRAEMSRVTVNVTELAREVAGELARAEPARRVDVAVAEGLRAEADPRLVRVVLENLLGNAWKFTADRTDARIDVGAERSTNGEHGAPVFFVRDNGIGFDVAHAGKIFDPFQRLPGAREFPGTGVGLASVQRAVRRHGGNVWVAAQPGRGATFSFTLEPRPLPTPVGALRGLSDLAPVVVEAS